MRFWVEFSLAVATNALIWGFGVIGHDLNPIWGYVISLTSVIVIGILWHIQKPNNSADSSKIEGPDFPVRDVFLYINPHTLEDGDCQEIEKKLLSKLSTNKIGSWGRLAGKGREMPLTPIPQEYWATARFTFLYFEEANEQNRHAYGPQNGNQDYRDLQFNRHQITSEIPQYRPLDADDRSLLWCFIFICSLILIGIFSIFPFQSAAKLYSRLVAPSIRQGTLLVESLHLEMGPQTPSGNLSVSVPITNNRDSAIDFEGRVLAFQFNGVSASNFKSTMVATLSGHERIYFTFPQILKEAVVGESYKIDLSYTIDYGPPSGPMQWSIHKEMHCLIPAKDYNAGLCEFTKLTNEAVQND